MLEFLNPKNKITEGHKSHGPQVVTQGSMQLTEEIVPYTLASTSRYRGIAIQATATAAAN